MSATRTPRFLMANLGSEVSRVLSWKEKGDREMASKCMQRSHDILEKIISAPQMRTRKVEIELLREVINDLSSDKPRYSVSAQELKNYFLPFAMRVFSA